MAGPAAAVRLDPGARRLYAHTSRRHGLQAAITSATARN